MPIHCEVRVLSNRLRLLVQLTSLTVIPLLASACASTGAVPRPFPSPGVSIPSGSPVPPADRGGDGRRDGVPVATAVSPGDLSTPVAPETSSAVIPTQPPLRPVDTALSLLGAPYRNGGSAPGDGFDCSGFTQWVFAQHGITLPRESREQFGAGLEIDSKSVAAGDLLFFTTVSKGASHVGIALDEDRFVHAPSSRGVVRIERRSSAYWHRRYVGARRVDSGTGASSTVD